MPAVILQPRSSQDAPDKGPGLEAITTALLVLATVFVLLRFAARFKRGLTYGPDDWLIVVSLVLLLLYLGTPEANLCPALLLRRRWPQLWQYVCELCEDSAPTLTVLQ